MIGRRVLAGLGVATVLALAAPQASSAIGSGALPRPSVDGARTAVLDLTDAVDETTTLDAALPVPAMATGIGPGTHILTTIPGPEGGTFGCTASYVHAAGSELFLAAAGHCFLPEAKSASAGPGADHSLAGTVVKVCVSGCSFGGTTGFTITGTLVTLGPVAYARQASPSGDQVGHDFGLVRIPAALRDQVRTSLPVYGGPTTVGTLGAGEVTCHYGNGVVLGETFPTMGRLGVGLFTEPEAWFAAHPASPGDSGSAFATCTPGADGLSGNEAIGTLTHITASGIAGTTTARGVAMARSDAGLAVQPVLGALPAVQARASKPRR